MDSILPIWRKLDTDIILMETERLGTFYLPVINIISTMTVQIFEVGKTVASFNEGSWNHDDNLLPGLSIVCTSYICQIRSELRHRYIQHL
jgi:hypothetical protein